MLNVTKIVALGLRVSIKPFFNFAKLWYVQQPNY
jgi:hypothetical protein